MNCSLKGYKVAMLLAIMLLATPDLFAQQIGWLLNANSVISDSAGNYYPHSFSSNSYRSTRRGFTTVLRYSNSPVVEWLSFDSEGRLTNLKMDREGSKLSDEEITYKEDSILSFRSGYLTAIPEKPEQFLHGNLLAENMGICNSLKCNSLKWDNRKDCILTIRCDRRLPQTNRSANGYGTVAKYIILYSNTYLSIARMHASYYPELGKVLQALQETIWLSRDSNLITYYNQNQFIPELGDHNKEENAFTKENFNIGFWGNLSHGKIFFSSVFRDLPEVSGPMFPTSKYDILEYQLPADSVSPAVQISVYAQRDKRNGYTWHMSAVIGDQKYLVAYSSYHGELVPPHKFISVMQMPVKLQRKQTITVKNYNYYAKANWQRRGPIGADSLVISEEKLYLKTTFK